MPKIGIVYETLLDKVVVQRTIDSESIYTEMYGTAELISEVSHENGVQVRHFLGKLLRRIPA